MNLTSFSAVRTAIVWLALTALAVTMGCAEDSPSKPSNNSITTGIYKPMTSPENALYNFRAAYIAREPDEFARVLHGDYTFFFDSGDVNDPTTPTPQEWNRDSEVQAAGFLLSGNANSDGLSVLSVALSMTVDNLNWIDVIPSGVPGSPTWKVATVPYNLELRAINDAGAQTYFTAGGQAQFAAHEVSAGEWRIVRWVDVGNLRRVELTWGKVKFLFSK